MTPKCFRLEVDVAGYKAGTFVYDFLMCDYGLANEDTRNFGFEHVSVTLDPAGGYPSFTVPARVLKEQTP